MAHFAEQTSQLATTDGSHARVIGDDLNEVLSHPELETEKRARDEEGYELLGRETKRARNKKREVENQLAGDYTSPKTSISTSVSADDHKNTTRKEAPRLTRTMGGPFKPRNTLRDSFRSPRTSKLAADQISSHAGSAQSIQQLPTMSSFGVNVERKSGQESAHADEFVDDSTPPSKKRKTGSHAIMASFSDPVDLTGDEHTALTRKATPKKSASPNVTFTTGSSSTSIRKKKMFRDTELSRANKPTNSFQKTPRKSKVTSNSSQTSSQHSSMTNHPDENSLRGSNSPTSPKSHIFMNYGVNYGDIAEKVVSARRVINQAGTVPPNHTIAGPTIGLGQSVDITKRNIKGGSKASTIATGKALRDQLPRPEQHEGRSSETPAKPESRNSNPYFVSNSKSPQREDNDRTVQKGFVGETGVGRFKTKDMMQAEFANVSHKVSPINEDNGSADELHGGNTIQLSGRAASPRKHNNGHHISSIDLPLTAFTESVKSEDQNKSRGFAKKKAQNAISAHCKILAFYASSCVLTEGDLELRYEADTNTLDLFQDGFPKVIKGKQRVVGLGINEVHKINYHSGCPRLQIDGSKNEVSHGKICLCFVDWAGTVWFQDAMRKITENCVMIHACTLEGISKRFATQSELIQQSYRLQMNRYEDIESQLPKGRLSQSKQWFRNEQIPFEPVDDKPSRTKLRTQMQGGTLAEELLQISRNGEECTSKFFQGQQRTRRSTRTVEHKIEKRERSPTPERWTKIHKPKRWPHAVFYPAQGLRRVTVDFDDLTRLDEGEFLNDSIVSFALRQIEENMAPEFKEQVHFFNSFFYSSLSTKNGKKAFNYDAVKRWTKNTDIFNVPYIIIPICLDLHWFVAIICNLDKLSRKISGLVDDICEPRISSAAIGSSIEEKLVVEGNDKTVENDVVKLAEHVDGLGTTGDSADAMKKLCLSDKSGENSRQSSVFRFDEDILESNLQPHDAQLATAMKVSKRKKSPSTRTYDPDSPVIITLDSLGSPHTAEIRNLKDYILEEAEKKRGMAVDRDKLQGITAKGIPEQTNFCDCGLYVVGYIESFAKDPKAFVDKITSRQLDRQADFASFNPSAKRNEIRNELLKLQCTQEAEHQAEKRRKAKMTRFSKNPSDKETKRAKIVLSEHRQHHSVFPRANEIKTDSMTEISGPNQSGTVASASMFGKVEQNVNNLDMKPARVLETHVLSTEKAIPIGGQVLGKIDATILGSKLLQKSQSPERVLPSDDGSSKTDVTSIETNEKKTAGS